MKRTPLKRRTPLRARRRLRQRGARTMRELNDREAFRLAVMARSLGMCELSTPACPLGPHHADHAHHIWPSDRDKGRHDPERGLAACHGGHRWLHGHPAMAREHGWLLHEGDER